MMYAQFLVPTALRKKLTRQFLTSLSDHQLLLEANEARRTFGVCPQRISQEIVRRRDNAAAKAKEYRKRSDDVRPSVILDQALARYVRHPSRIRSQVEQALHKGSPIAIAATDLMPHTSPDNVEAIITMASNVLVARQMSGRADAASRRAQRLHDALRLLQLPLPVTPSTPKPSTRRWIPRLPRVARARGGARNRRNWVRS